MNDIKIAFFDIDGTLIDMNKKIISEKMLQTLIRLKEKNIIICIATGRSPIGLPKFQKVEFDAFLTFNGSYCFNEREIIFSNPIPTNDVKKIINNASSLNRPVSIATAERLASNGKDQDLIEYYAFSKLEIEIAEDFDKVVNEKILEYYHLTKEEAIAFGDGNNDIEMLQAVGLGVAMENASDQLKKIADDMCGHVANDGIYYYCVEHGLI